MITITDDMIEAAAVAIYSSVTGRWKGAWALITGEVKEMYRRDARMALEAAFRTIR